MFDLLAATSVHSFLTQPSPDPDPEPVYFLLPEQARQEKTDFTDRAGTRSYKLKSREPSSLLPGHPADLSFLDLARPQVSALQLAPQVSGLKLFVLSQQLEPLFARPTPLHQRRVNLNE